MRFFCSSLTRGPLPRKLMPRVYSSTLCVRQEPRVDVEPVRAGVRPCPHIMARQWEHRDLRLDRRGIGALVQLPDRVDLAADFDVEVSGAVKRPYRHATDRTPSLLE